MAYTAACIRRLKASSSHNSLRGDWFMATKGSNNKRDEKRGDKRENDRQAGSGGSPEAAPASEPTAKASGKPEPEHIAVAAYYRAEQRGFAGDQQVDDWLSAEKALAAEGAAMGDDDLKARGVPVEDIQPDEVEQWAERLDVTPERLRVAIQRVGPVSSEVRRFLQDSGAR
jgi:hypothetical protein